jgi:hypothetical protein
MARRPSSGISLSHSGAKTLASATPYFYQIARHEIGISSAQSLSVARVALDPSLAAAQILMRFAKREIAALHGLGTVSDLAVAVG